MTPLQIVWADEAREVFLGYIRYIAERSPAAALRLFDAVENSLRPVSYFPLSGTPGRVPGTYEIVSHPNYIAIYQVSDGCIEVVDFTHARKLYPPTAD
ncbi:type II toxin-antitoxin system RelE/ParE family toxin [Caballeronia sp. GAFFF1]|uniref:type II toxin-antitoxin system RelE/ParE family toxin n=1 Tax=Caballeronia sp. GAFFF1 TaxID=2921779 RepID=UPI002029097D|nr:type II toxin-antitoxin system RelE/ParE family toxin [Caballeronia sp. GAFFF1]